MSYRICYNIKSYPDFKRFYQIFGRFQNLTHKKANSITKHETDTLRTDEPFKRYLT